MKLMTIIALAAGLVAAAPISESPNRLVSKREKGELSTWYIFTDDPVEGGKVDHKKKREEGELSTCEAKAAGCVYDPGLLFWTRPYCKAEDIADEFVRSSVHEVFRDKEKLHPLNLTYIESGEFGEAYDRVGHHKGHCLNAWKVLTEAAARLSPQTPEVLIPGMAVAWGHVVHCSEDVVVPNENSRWRKKPYIRFWPGYEGCHLLRAPRLLDLGR
ncbi:hypothetical protein C8035_v005418 [Colletotrichum spinosum]|uniref:Uncharacterized protein n=1 Tax=Colletotrichum spinosum TaxID=1347390 RepID=A0A4R8QKS8_9PEZI|nr:hypothetical protein C8035_v005418 [Colletotrichum spinosum]